MTTEQLFEPLLFNCKEPEGEVTREVKFCQLSIEKLKYFHEKLSPFKVLFTDFIKDDLDSFIKSFVTIHPTGEISPRGLLWEVDDVGLLFFVDVLPNDSAEFHVTFWDKRLRGREGLVKGMIEHVMGLLNLHRVSTNVPVYAKATDAAVLRVGFIQEGTLREAALFEGKRYDTHIYSILRKEIETNVVS